MADLAGLGRADPFSRSRVRCRGDRRQSHAQPRRVDRACRGQDRWLDRDALRLYEGWPKTPGFLRLYLEDADASYERAIGAGATSVTDVTELFWGDRIGRVRDPLGNIWWLQSHATDVPYDQMQTRMGDPEMVEAMRYVQQTLVDALREQRD